MMNTETTTKVNIKLYASRLRNVAGVFKGTSDPYAVLTLLAGGPNENPRVLGKTEVIKNSLSPDWITQFQVDYTFGKETRINVGIFDEVRKTGKPIPMGSSQFELGEILGSRGNVKAKNLKPGGTIFCRVTKAADEDYGTLQLQFRGEDLKISEGLFGGGKPDPFFVLNAQAEHTGGTRVWHQEYRSEVMRDNHRPTWHLLEIPMEKLCGGDPDRAIQVEVYSWEKSGNHRSIGKFQTSVNGLLTAATMPDQGLELISKGKVHGKIYVVHSVIFGGTSLPPSKPLGVTASAPMITTTQQHCHHHPPAQLSSSDSQADSKSESTPVPLPPPRILSMSSYPISLSESASSLPPAIPPPAFDMDDGPMLSESFIKSFDELDPSSITSSPLKARVSRIRRPTFVDYLSGGLEISLSVAIDFTGSNGDPRVPGTLHHIHQSGDLNDYEKALTAMGGVIARYDYDQKFPVYGFGAKYDGQLKNCFQVGGAPELKGLKGVLEGYRTVFHTGLTMSGPTVFAEVIQHAAIKAQEEFERKQVSGRQSYSILLILTDGCVSDEENTKIALKYASSAPLSILIVGVGEDDFSKMKILEDAHKLDKDMRGTVKFVEFNQFRDNRQALTLESLSEIPEQVVHYFQGKGIQPLPAKLNEVSDVYTDDYDDTVDVDLEYSFEADGTIRLADSRQATWNAYGYGNVGAYLKDPAIIRNFDSSINSACGQSVSSTLYSSTTPTPLSPGREQPMLSPYVTSSARGEQEPKRLPF